MPVDTNELEAAPACQAAWSLARRVAGDESGAAAGFLGIGAMVFVGAAGLMVDVAGWRRAKRVGHRAAGVPA